MQNLFWMNKLLKHCVAAVFLLLAFHAKVCAENPGHLSGVLLLDDSWEKRVYLSYIETFEKEYAVSNNFIIASAEVDSLGRFQLALDQVPSEWSLLRLHMVKKGVSPNSLVIGSRGENFYFLVAQQSSEIALYNTDGNPIFKNTRVEGAPYMGTFEYIRRISDYPNSIDYEHSLIEKEFIVEVVCEKLKAVADTCQNPLVSLYALYQIAFLIDDHHDPAFYDAYFSKRQDEQSTYFKSLRSKFPPTPGATPLRNFQLRYILLFMGFGAVVFIGFYVYRRRNQSIDKLSVQERKVFELIRNGLSNKEISAECNIELTTVKSHVSRIYTKLNIKSRREAMNLKVK